MEKKLVYILNQYSNNSVQHFYHILNLLIAMANKGVKIVLIIEKAEDTPKINHENIEVICQTQKNNFKRGLELFKILKGLIKRGYCRIFVRITINSTIISIIAGKLFGAKTYYWQSGTTFLVDSDKSFVHKLKWRLQSYSKFWFVKKFVDYFVTGPETMVDYYINVVKVNRKKMILLYNDIDIKRFSLPSIKEKESIRKELGFGKTEKIILMVHRLSPVRKTDMYIPDIFESDSLKKYNAHVVIIGTGPEYPLLKSKIENSTVSDRIHLLGSKPNSEITKYYEGADLFINPSYTEGFPRVVIEAMACGLPVIATDAGGTADLFGVLQKNYVVSRENHIEFREKLSTIFEDEKKLRKMSLENLSVVKSYSTDSVSDMYIERIF